MEYIFKAKSHSAYLFKVLSEILQSNLKTSCFQLKPDGIYLRQMDDNRRTLIDLHLDAGNFNSFKFDGRSSMFMLTIWNRPAAFSSTLAFFQSAASA